ncbi:MAG: hypothetical protein HC831_12775 [Chloroflexia bacterium]|nr:hypothetical protein [Chloroflexia bacterium]
MEFQVTDRIFMFTDGYKDQNGGQLNKKYSSKEFKKSLVQTGKLGLAEQMIALEQNYDRWKGYKEQVDDVLILGINL